jgi:hypothetical protein
MDPQIEELLSLEAVRSRAHIVLKLAEQGRLNHFNYRSERMEQTTDYVLKLIQVRPRPILELYTTPSIQYIILTQFNRHSAISVLISTISSHPMAVGSISKSAGFPA